MSINTWWPYCNAKTSYPKEWAHSQAISKNKFPVWSPALTLQMYPVMKFTLQYTFSFLSFPPTKFRDAAHQRANTPPLLCMSTSTEWRAPKGEPPKASSCFLVSTWRLIFNPGEKWILPARWCALVSVCVCL